MEADEVMVGDAVTVGMLDMMGGGGGHRMGGGGASEALLLWVG